MSSRHSVNEDSIKPNSYLLATKKKKKKEERKRKEERERKNEMEISRFLRQSMEWTEERGHARKKREKNVETGRKGGERGK